MDNGMNITFKVGVEEVTGQWNPPGVQINLVGVGIQSRVLSTVVEDLLRRVDPSGCSLRFGRGWWNGTVGMIVPLDKAQRR
jgi:hypothetical protein